MVTAIGTNLYLCKIAMDIGAKHVTPDENGVRIAERLTGAVLVGFRSTMGDIAEMLFGRCV